MSVPIDTAPAFHAGTPTELFDLPSFYRTAARTGRQWDLAPDGGRFLIMDPAGATNAERARPQIVVVLNWDDELKRLAPAK